MKVVVVEDRRDEEQGISDILASDQSIIIVGHFRTIEQSIHWLRSNQAPDLILVHNNFSTEEKQSLAAFSHVKAQVSFPWIDEVFSYEAFRITSAEGSVLNPLLQSGSILTHQQDRRALLQLSPRYRTRFLVKNGQKFAAIQSCEIAYFFSEGRFIFFKTLDDHKYLVEYTLEELDAMLDPEQFYRANRSLILSYQSIHTISPYSGNRIKLSLKPSYEKEIIVSREKVASFKEWMGA